MSEFAMTRDGYQGARQWLEERNLWDLVKALDGYSVVAFANAQIAKDAKGGEL